MELESRPLHEAARLWSDHATLLLLEHGADVNVRTKDGTTSLHVAAQNGRLDNTRTLLEHGANVGAENGRGRTASQVAPESLRVHDKIMALLLEYGAK